MQLTNNKRYATLKADPGIKKDLFTSIFQVTKSIKGKRFYASFDSLREARHWKNTFVPEMKTTREAISPTPLALATAKASMTFREVWELYKKQMLSTLEISTQERRLEIAKFFNGIWDVSMSEMNPHLISKHITSKKEESIKNSDGRRFCFDDEIKALKAIFNWYREEIDHTFSSPILKRHKVMGRIKEKVYKEKKMHEHELHLFFKAMEDRPFWHDFAMAQFYLAGRVQEIAGIQKDSVDLKNQTVLIKDVAIWNRGKKFSHLKTLPKNGEVRECGLNETLNDIFERRLKELPANCNFVFNIDGKPVGYRQVQYHYNMGLQKCGLDHRFSSTHIMRHSMATLTRLVTGSLESTQAVTGHKDQRMAQHYASISSNVQKDAINQVEAFLKNSHSCENVRELSDFAAKNRTKRSA